METIPARFVSRPNRFVVVVELEDGRRVRAHLPNTGRLAHLGEPGRPFLLVRDGVPPRVTEYTAIRAWDGCWVALEAAKAPQVLASWLDAGNPLPGFGSVVSIDAEVAVGGHRLDLRCHTPAGPVWVEVKSGGRARRGTALLSGTPSLRGAAHLGVLAELVDAGQQAAAAFVIQRGDAVRLMVGGDADPGWLAAVRSAREAGVAILAFGCNVTETTVRIDRVLPVEWE